jgi:hypothetical protein
MNRHTRAVLDEASERRQAEKEALRLRFLKAAAANPDVPLAVLARRFSVGKTTAQRWAREAAP